MAKYLLIESRDPYQHADARSLYTIADDLAKAGNAVTVFLVQNGVLPARRNAKDSPLDGLRSNAQGITVLADDFSLKERAISADRLADDVKPVPIEDLVDLLAEPGTKAIWH
ncbi:MAG: DsrE family protein [Dehalococcoidia bacterium]